MNTSRDRTVAIVVRSCGPYHVARLAAAARELAATGASLVGIELCDTEETRDWLIDRAALPFRLLTVAKGVRLDDGLRQHTKSLLKMLAECQPSAVAVTGYDRPEMRAAMRWARRHGAASILMSETKWDDRPRPVWKRLYAARHVARADAAIVSGAAAGEYLVSLGMQRERIFRHYGAVDNEFFAAQTAAIRAADRGEDDGSHPYFLSCCRLIEKRKNLLRLLDAYSVYRSLAKAAAWNLVLCGDGPDRNLLATRVAARRLDGVTFAGFQQVNNLARYYARAGCFVHPAINEAWGLVVNEAMAAGLPVLVSRRCGCAYDLVHDGVNGFTFDPYDADELAAQMQEVTSLPTGRLVEMGCASQRIIARFGPDQFARGLHSAIECAWRVREIRTTGQASGR